MGETIIVEFRRENSCLYNSRGIWAIASAAIRTLRRHAFFFSKNISKKISKQSPNLFRIKRHHKTTFSLSFSQTNTTLPHKY